MFLILVRSHDPLDSRPSLISNLGLFFLLEHQLVHALLAELPDLLVLLLPHLLDLVLTTLLELDHVGPHI